MLQIYKSDIVDLFRNPEDQFRELEIQFREGQIIVHGATTLVREDLKNPDSRKNLKHIFARGLDNRLMRSNDVNETSSRSHLLFICRVIKRDN